MDLDLKGYKANCGEKLMGDLIIHTGRKMTESETRIVVNYGIKNGIKYLSEFPDEIADKICDPQNNEFEEYDDTPEFVSLPKLERVINRVYDRRWRWESAQDLFDDIKEILEDEVY